MSTDHARLAPSASARWVNCPGSQALCELRQPKDTPNAASTRGTELHEYAGEILNGRMTLADIDQDDVEGLNIVSDYIGIIEEYKRDLGKGVKAEYEVVLRNPTWHAEIWGTADCVLVSKDKKKLVLIDLKTGYNPVVAEDNPQLLCYAALAVGHYRIKPEEVELVIFQPRAGDGLPPVRAWSLDDFELHQEISHIRHAANLALSDEGAHIFRPGLKQCKWCPISGECEAQARSQAVADFFDGPADTAIMSDEQIAEMLNQIEEVDNFISALRAQAHKRMMDDPHCLEGWKVVHKRTVRKWEDPQEVQAILDKTGRPYQDYMDLKLKSFTKILKDEEMAGLVGHLVVKPLGELQIAPDSDPRDEATAEDDFS